MQFECGLTNPFPSTLHVLQCILSNAFCEDQGLRSISPIVPMHFWLFGCLRWNRVKAACSILFKNTEKPPGALRMMLSEEVWKFWQKVAGMGLISSMNNFPVESIRRSHLA